MRISKMLLAVGLICLTSQAIADAESYQKDLKRYEQLKPQVLDILKTSGELFHDMPDAVRQRINGNPTEWRAMMDKVSALEKKTTQALGDQPYDGAWGACIQMQNMLLNYWQDLNLDASHADPSASTPRVKQSKAWYIEERMACLERYVFGPIDTSNTAIINVWDNK